MDTIFIDPETDVKMCEEDEKLNLPMVVAGQKRGGDVIQVPYINEKKNDG